MSDNFPSMSATTTTRQTADERREAVLKAARHEFARHGLHGASTDAIARRAGISQPYLFRLFGSKKELFLAVNESCFERTLELFRRAAAGMSGTEALRAMGAAYEAMIEEDRTMLQGQLQAYAASVEDAEIRESSARGFGRLVDYVETVSGADRKTVAHFFASGMLYNVLAAMQYEVTAKPDGSWASRLAEGCKEAASE
ncbi:MAG TPA: TetR/AcrR family transcriptional regulator [Gaiellaceae bacterium]|nr:TetR/AcrR family transcriptional regulator [Gaiellaceae bacterium]